MLNALLDHTLLSAVIAVFSTIFLLCWLGKRPQPLLANSGGRKMKQILQDTRVRRFTHGREISDEGYKIGGGEPYAMFNGNRREVVLCAPEHLRDFYAGDARGHAKAPDGNMGYFLHRLFGQCVGAQNGQDWVTTRALFDPTFSRTSTLEYLHALRGEIVDWIHSVRHDKTTVEVNSQSFTAKIPGIFAHLPLKLIALMLYGKGLTDKDFTELTEIACMREELSSYAFLSSEMISRLYEWLPTRANRLLTTYAVKFRRFNLRIIETARKNRVDCPASDILKAMESSSPLTMKQFLHTIDEILFENLDVTSSALCYLLINVGGDVAVQNDLRLEVCQHVNSSDPSQYETYMASSDTLLEYCCLETRRLCPPLCFTFCERAPSNKIIGGFYVPMHTDVTVDWYRINLYSPIWSTAGSPGHPQTDGMQFDPSRFQRLSKTEYRYSIVGYGAGVRKCLGRHFANLAMRVILAEIVSRYSITSRGKPWDMAFRKDRFVLTPQDHEVLFRDI